MTRQTGDCTDDPSFEVSNRYGPVPLEVTFTNTTCPGEFVTFVWELGDGITIRQETPSKEIPSPVTRVYDREGVYLVRLTGIREDGSTSSVTSFRGQCIDGDGAEVSATVEPDSLILVNARVARNEKIWIFLEAPEDFPDTMFARPRNTFCVANGRYLSVFKVGINLDTNAADLFHDHNSEVDNVGLLVNLQGLGKLVITSAVGDDPAFTVPVQTINIDPQ
jgi:hypothetical protein